MTDRARIFLLAPTEPDPALFPRLLSEALGADDVAAVLLSAGALAMNGAADLVHTIQAAGAAALVPDDTRLVGRLKADGVQVGSGAGDLRMAAESLRPERIVGAGNIHSRDTAMEAGELGVDYVFFGKLYGDTHDEPHRKSLELAEWWAELMQIPCVALAGRSLGGVAIAADSGADFVALHHFVWAHEGGPAQAIREAAEVLGAAERHAA
jgi:thiamine-phosphate pyrophosphorylase